MSCEEGAEAKGHVFAATWVKLCRMVRYMHLLNLLSFYWWISISCVDFLFPTFKHNSLKNLKALFMINMAQCDFSCLREFTQTLCDMLFRGVFWNVMSLWSLPLCDRTTSNWFPVNPTDESLACSCFTFLTSFQSYFRDKLSLLCTFLQCLQGGAALKFRCCTVFCS